MGVEAVIAKSAKEVRKVVKVTRSPMNPKRWSLDLECGHELWLTSDRKPSRKSALCPKCFQT